MTYLAYPYASPASPICGMCDTIPLYIVKSATNSTTGQNKHELLTLTLKWNRVDIAANFIMKDEQDWEVRILNYFLYFRFSY